MEKSNIKNVCKIFLWSVFLPQIVALGLIIVFAMFYKDLEVLQNSILYIFTMSILAQVCFFAIYYLYSKKNKVNILSEIKSVKNKVNIKNILMCILISVIAVFGLLYFVSLFDLIFYQIGYMPSDLALPLNNFAWFIVNVLISAVTPAIMEELIFRGIIFKGLREKGFWLSAVVSSIMFILVHQSLGSVVYPIIMGFVFCLVVEKTGSILYSMVIHFCNNFIVILIEFISTINGKSVLPSINLWWQYLIAVLVAIIAVLIIYLIVKKMLVKKEEIFVEQDVEVDALSITEDQIEQEKLEKKTDEKAIIYSVLISFAFWLVLVITSLK